MSKPLSAPEHLSAHSAAGDGRPVILADGHYERRAVEKYLQAKDVSPRMGEALAHKPVLPNLMAAELCKLALNFD